MIVKEIFKQTKTFIRRVCPKRLTVIHMYIHTLMAALKDALHKTKNRGKEQSRMCLGRAFQRKGAAMEKALSPQVRCLVLSGCERRLASGDLAQRHFDMQTRRIKPSDNKTLALPLIHSLRKLN